jgi:L-aspartate oxidase
MSHLDGQSVRTRFPRIFETLAAVGLDLTKDRIPVLPAAHYAMGGVRTRLTGETSVPGLYAAGEVAATGVHGANRLASNSLLEGLVFGGRAGAAMLDYAAGPPRAIGAGDLPRAPSPERAAAIADEVRTLAWEKIGILRDAASLGSVLGRLEEICGDPAPGSPASRPEGAATRAGLEARNLAIVARSIARCALFREESRGAHFRTDWPARDDARWRCHTLLRGQKPTRLAVEDAGRKVPLPGSA